MNDFLNGQVENDGFLRVAAASPQIRVADVEGNAEVALAAVRAAVERGVRALVLPELNSVLAIPRPICSITAHYCMPARLLWCISSMRPVSCRLSLLSVFPLQLPRISTTAPPCAARASFWASRPRSICPTMASSTSAAGLLRRPQIPCGSSLPVRVRFRWVRSLSTAAVTRVPRIWCWALRSARTCGCRRPLRPRWRLPVRR